MWGYRRIWAYLKKNGIEMNKKKVLRICRENGFLVTLKRHKAIRTVKPKIKPSKPREIIGIDMTSIQTNQGKVYYIAVIDWYTRELLGSHVSMRARTEEWLKALDNALNEGWPYGAKSQGIKLISDNGTQPTSRRFNEFCESLGIRQIFTTYNNPKGNANTERYFRTAKEEILWPREYETFEELKSAIEEFERFYNYEYPHSAIGYKSPKEYFKQTCETLPKVS